MKIRRKNKDMQNILRKATEPGAKKREKSKMLMRNLVIGGRGHHLRMSLNILSLR